MNSRRVSFCLIVTLACGVARGEDLFFRQHSYKTGAGTQSVCVADFNGDGRKDMATADLAQSTVSIVLAQPDGTYVRSPIDLGLPGNPFMVAAGDINADGRTDLVASKFHEGGDVAIMIGNGNGTFQAPVTLATQGGKATSICLGDVNGDGRLDLLVCCSTTTLGLEVYFGNGNGTFTFSATYAILQSLFDMVLADLNGDGRLDVAIANWLTGCVSVLLNQGNGTFSPHVRYTTLNSSTRGVAAGDFNGDGRIDLCAVNENQNIASVLLNLGNGTFEANGGTRITVGQNPFGIKTADVNGDGRLDFVTAGKFSNSITVVLGNGNGTFGAPRTFDAGSAPMGLAIAQLVGDASLDVVTANSGDGSVLVMQGRGDGTFLTLNAFPTGNDAQAIVQADLNADGKMDFVTANKQPSTVSVLLGRGDGTVLPAVHYGTGTSSMPTACAAGDVNGDGKIDIVATRSGTGGVAVMLGNGNGTLQAATNVTTGNATLGVALADIDADAKLDLIVMSNNTRSIEIYPGNGNGTFRTGNVYHVGVNCPEIQVADLNGDGRLDIVAANRLQSCVSVMINAGGGAFAAPIHYTALTASFNTRGVFLADLNRDGRLDIVAAGAVIETFMNAGDGTFPAANRAAYPVSPTLSDVVAADFSGDGNIDLAATSLNAFDLNVLLGGSGTFALQGKYKVGSMPNSMVAGDYNGDGKIDVAIAHGAGSVAIMLNIGTGQQRQNQTITFGTLPAKTYGDAPFALSATASSGLPVSFSVVSGPATLSGSMLTITGAGTVTVRASQAGNAQFNPAPSVDRTLSVAKKALTVTADSKVKGYGAALPAFTATYTGFVNGDTAAVLSPSVSFSTTATAASPVGSYPIVPSGAAAANYTLTFVNGTLSILKVPLTVNIDNKSKVYGAALPAFTATYAGFVNGDTAAVLNPAPTFSTTATATSNVGTYPITGSGGAAVNYTLSYVNGTLTITKATPVITWNNPADIIEGTALSATQLNATASVPGSFVYAPPAGTVLPVGLQQSLSVVLTPTDSTNYNSMSKVVFINVLPANRLNQTITFGAIADRTYGDPLGLMIAGTASSGLPVTFTVVSGPATVGSVNPSGQASVAILGAGTITIRADQAGNAIYNPAPSVSRTFNVAKKALTITAQDKSRVYGVGNPALTAAYSGFVNGDTASVLNPGVILSTTATATSAVGAYPITASGAGAVNYTISYVAGTLTITKATPAITWNNPANMVAGDALSSAQLNATANVAGTFVYSPAAGTVLQAGTHILSVTFTPTDAANYTTATKSVSLTVNANRPPTITASGSPLTGTAPLTVAFTATASDPDGDALTYAWNFADSTPAGAGANPSHTFTATGTFNVTVTVQDTHGGSATASVTVIVTKPGSGGGIKAGTFKPLSVAKFGALVKAPSSGKDSLSVSGTLSELPSDFAAAGASVDVEIGGATETFILDSKGRGKSGASTLTILKKKKRGVTTVTFTIKMKNGSWNDQWKEFGLQIEADAPLGLVTLPVHEVVLPVNLVLKDIIYEGSADAKCNAKAGQGKLKK